MVMYPICAYFLIFAPTARRASRDWLTRVLGRPAGLPDIWRHFGCFATCVLDRILLLNGREDLFEIAVRGEEIVTALRSQRRGAFLFGAHLGSFEAARAAGRAFGETRVSLVMYEDNARKTNEVLNAINPALAADIIGLGKPGSMLAVSRRLEEGYLVGLLADRGLDNERVAEISFFGEPAKFPTGPFRMAAMLRRPVVLMVGLYRGGNRYEVIFEWISDPAPADEATDQAIEATMRRYVDRLEFHCRSAPCNWFNFHAFWN
jgi:predicted LPLAT superfamily acyltransferase